LHDLLIMWKKLCGCHHVIGPKQNGKLQIYINFRKLNDTTKKNSYLLPFISEVLIIVASHETYSFLLDDFSWYHQILIALKIGTIVFLLLIGTPLCGLLCLLELTRDHQLINYYLTRHFEIILIHLWRFFLMIFVCLAIWIFIWKNYDYIFWNVESLALTWI
jgi:hypothetical protein